MTASITDTEINHQENVDHQEIAHFAALASQWWDLNGEFKTLHQINPTRLDYIEQQVGGLFGKTVLDVGCGGGILSESMAQRGAKVSAIDMGDAQIEVAKLHALETNTQLQYFQCTAESHAQDYPEHYDVITCMEMLEHVPDPSSVIAACVAMLKPGGQLILSTINRTPQAYMLMIVGAEQVLKIVAKGTHQHQKFIRPSELLAWCDRHQLQALDVIGVRFNPLTEQFRLSSNVSVNYMASVKKPAAEL